MDPLLSQMLGESASVEIQASINGLYNHRTTPVRSYSAGNGLSVLRCYG